MSSTGDNEQGRASARDGAADELARLLPLVYKELHALAETKRGDQYLLDAEAELKHVRPDGVPITASWQLDGMTGAQREAEELRREASGGNPIINPAPDPEPGNGVDKRSAIRSALGGTKVVSVGHQMRS